ncbi:MAG TPA: T9SS type A sorting domain-containing protein [Bacteroidia bacterium]|nr:T9SS type A sorting domain-containing protein [Bacteroidia bacterium]
MMKKNYLLQKSRIGRIFLLSMVFLQMFNMKVYATHMAGADLTYRYLGNNQYELNYTFYRDCVGISAQTSIDITYSSLTCGINSIVTLFPLPGTGREITRVCPGATTTCNGGTEPGIQKWEYSGVVTLSNCPDWIFGTRECCRNGAITTLVNPLSENMYIEATLDNSVSQNNSPVFSNIPIAFECIGQNNYYNHGGLDTDGDSLVYSFVAPLNDANLPVVYGPGYSVNNPITSVPGVSIDPQSGDIFMHPTTPEIAVMAVEIDEYRNGVLIGTVIRDLQIYTITCSNELPLMSGIDSTNIYTTQACLGSTVCFDVYSADLDTPDSLGISWNNGIPAGTFTINPGRRPTGHFCWTPTAADVRTQPWYFTVTVFDDACPSNGVQTFSYGITVSELNVSASSNDVSCAGGHNGSATVNPSGTGPFEYVWMPGEFLSQSINHLFPGTYSVMVSNGAGCHTTEYITITEPPALQSDISGYDANCSGQAGSAAVHVSGGTGAYTYSWNTTPPALTDSISNLGAGTYIVLVRDANNCILRDTVSVAGATGFTASMQTTPATCNASDGTATVSVTGGSGDFSYAWTPSVSNGSSATGLTSGYYSVLITDNQGGCAQTVSALVGNTSGITASLVSSTNAHCENSEDGSATVSASGGMAPYEYLWQPSGDISASVNNLAPGEYIVRVSDYNNCPAYLTVNIGYDFAIPSIDLGPDTVICMGDSLVLDAGAGYASYFWSDQSTSQQIVVYTDGNYSVLVSNAEGCENFDNIQVTTIACQSASRPSHSYHDSPIVYPNPAADEINIVFTPAERSDVQIRIVNSVGDEMYLSQQSAKGIFRKKINIESFILGIYFVEIIYDGEKHMYKTIKL